MFNSIFSPQPAYSYAEIGLKPIYLSEVASRNTVDTSIVFCGFPLDMPLVSAPMKAVTGIDLANTLEDLGGLAFLPRTSDINKDIETFNQVKGLCFVSIPATGDFLQRAEMFLNNGARYFCIDVANGYHTIVRDAVLKLKDLATKKEKKIYIVTGNVASWEGYRYLAGLGVDGVRVNIGSGSVCSTSIETKIGVPTASLIREVAVKRNEILGLNSKWPAIIADGGIKTPGELSLAIALGADLVMSGSIFAGCDEAAGNIINYNGSLYKHYMGEASQASKGHKKNVEGADTLVSYKGSVKRIWQKFKDGLQSSMSYMGSKSIDQHYLLEDECFILLSQTGQTERGITAK